MPTHYRGSPEAVGSSRRKLLRRNGNITVALIDRGRRLIESLFPRHVALVVREMSPLSRGEPAELGRLCRLVGRAVGWSRAGKEASNGAVHDTLRLAGAL